MAARLRVNAQGSLCSGPATTRVDLPVMAGRRGRLRGRLGERGPAVTIAPSITPPITPSGLARPYTSAMDCLSVTLRQATRPSRHRFAHIGPASAPHRVPGPGGRAGPAEAWWNTARGATCLTGWVVLRAAGNGLPCAPVQPTPPDQPSVQGVAGPAGCGSSPGSAGNPQADYAPPPAFTGLTAPTAATRMERLTGP